MVSIARGWEADADRRNDWLLVKLKRPNRDADAEPPLAEQVWGLLQQHRSNQLILELDEIDALRSHLIGQLVLLQKRLCAGGGRIRLCGLSRINQDAIRLCRLDDQFQCFCTREEALHP